jgi:hypothetical protein
MFKKIYKKCKGEIIDYTFLMDCLKGYLDAQFNTFPHKAAIERLNLTSFSFLSSIFNNIYYTTK